MFNKMLRVLVVFFIFCFNLQSVFAECSSMDFTIELREYLQIQTITSPVLVANITDKTGNLYSPLSSKFRVISNSNDTKTLYLKSTSKTLNGMEESMFERGGRVYIAFTNLAKPPQSRALANCKLASRPEASPGVVAYPVTSIVGAKSKYRHGKGKYEIYVNNGTTDITVNIGANVLKSSFASNDTKGFYQATLSLTELDI